MRDPGAGGGWQDDAVVIAGDRKDRRIVVPVGIVELLKVVLLLAEIINYVAQVIPEGRAAIQIIGHGVGHRKLKLRIMYAAGVAHRMKDDLARALEESLDIEAVVALT